jgi:hypothetical protein
MNEDKYVLSPRPSGTTGILGWLTEMLALLM